MPASLRKILFVLPTLHAGGAERVMITLMNGLDRRLYAPEFLCLSADGPLRTLITPDIPFHNLGNTNHFFRRLPALPFALARIKPDVIVSTQAHMNFAVLLCRPFLPRRPAIIIREAIQPRFYGERPALGLIFRHLYRMLYPRADVLLSPAHIILEEFRRTLALSLPRAEVLYNPVNTDIVKADGVPGALSPVIRFICAGRLHPQKGYDQLLEGLKNFNPGYAWSLSILGCGKQEEELKSLLSSHHYSGSITLEGFKDNPWNDMAAADCLLLPSRSEGLPNVVLEALSLGVPVIALESAGGVAEIAALCTLGHVTVAKNMVAFMQAMGKVEKRTESHSRLPPDFHKDRVQEKFQRILDKTSTT